MIFNDGTVSSILRVSTYGRGVWECNIANNLAPLANFSATPTILCPGDTAHFSHNVNGIFTSLSWSFSGGTPATSTATAPAVVYSTPGVYNVTLTATNAIGSNSISKSGYIVVTNGQAGQVVEGFEGTTYVPTGWQRSNASGNDWQLYAAAGAYGASSKSITFDNFNIDAGGLRDKIIAPKVNLVGIANARIKFDVAYAPYSTTGYIDTLQVRVSTDCGHTWTTVYNRSAVTSPSLATAPANTGGSFVPTSSQWRTDSISLLAYVGNSVMVAFENIGHYGQALFLDNINIQLSPRTSFAANDTTICEGSTVSFSDSSADATSWSWAFAGGNPATSTAQHPSVTYSTAGTYNVSLTATNAIGSGMLTKSAHILVAANPLPVITASGNVLTATGINTYQWYINGVPIPGATSATYTAIDGGAYTVQGTNTAGCTGTSTAYNHSKLGLSNTLRNAGYELYPNPTTGTFTITGSGLHTAAIVLTCYNSIGAVVRREELEAVNGHIQSTINWSSLPRGAYTISIQDGDRKPVRSSLILQ
jgi:PKD repeat protein